MRRHSASPKRIILLVVLLYATPLFAQFDFPSMSGSSAAMGGMSVAIEDPSTAHSSIANLASLHSTTLTLAVRQNLMAKGLNYMSASAAIPLSFGGTSLSVIHFGDAEYNEQQFSFSYAIPLGENLSLGAAFHYLHSSTSDPYYDPLHRLTFSLALRYKPSEELSLAFRAYNPIAVFSDKESGMHTPAVFTLGASYWLSNELLAAAEVEKNLFYDASLRLGLQYCFHENYFARLGIQHNPILYTFGFGGRWKHFGADFSFQISSHLGTTPLVSLSYIF